MYIKVNIFLLLFSTFLYAQSFVPLIEPKNYNIEKVKLGKKLFFDKNFSKDKKISCASCHSDFGSDKNYVSVGIEGKSGNIQSLSVFNAVYNYKQFWNGRAKDLYEQIDYPTHDPSEMGISRKEIEKYLLKSNEYIKLFQSIYNQQPTYELFKDAIVSFEKTLITPNSKFDLYLQKKIKLSENEEKGFNLFKSYGCATCHNGINIGGNSMQLFGNVIEYPYIENQDDLYSLTKKEKDKNIFRVPSLRNVSKTPPYFHDASANTLDDAIIKMSYYNLGVILEKNEIKYIKAFLKTLDGEEPKTWKNNVQ